MTPKTIKAKRAVIQSDSSGEKAQSSEHTPSPAVPEASDPMQTEPVLKEASSEQEGPEENLLDAEEQTEDIPDERNAAEEEMAMIEAAIPTDIDYDDMVEPEPVEVQVVKETAVPDKGKKPVSGPASRTRNKRSSVQKPPIMEAPESKRRKGTISVKKEGTLKPSSSVPNADDMITQRMIDHVAKTEVHEARNLSNRKLAYCRAIDFEWFGRNQLDIEPKFLALSLRDFCSYNVTASVNLAREFYEHISFHADKGGLKLIKVRVEDREHIFSINDVCRTFGARTCTNTTLVTIEKDAAYEELLGKPVSYPGNYLESTGLDLEHRVLHRSVMYCLVPRVGSQETMIPRDVQYMVHLKRMLPINLGTILFEHMEWCVQTKGKTLPFAHIIMALLQTRGVDVAPRDATDEFHTLVFGAATIKSMGYVLERGVWEKRKEQEKPPAKGKGTASGSSPENSSLYKVQRLLSQEIKDAKKEILDEILIHDQSITAELQSLRKLFTEHFGKPSAEQGTTDQDVEVSGEEENV